MRLSQFFPRRRAPRFPLDPGLLCDGELELRLENVHASGGARDWVPFYEFTMLAHEDGDSNGHVGRQPPRFAGNISLRVGHTPEVELYYGHIGYGVDAAFRGRRFAARSCRLLLPLARAHGLNPIWITCNPDNIASRRTCELIGATYVETVSVPRNSPLWKRGELFKCRYRL